METPVNPQQEEIRETVPQTPAAGPKTSNASIFLMGVLGVVCLVCVGGLVLFVWQVKKASTKSSIVKVADVFDLSAAKINGKAIPYADYATDLKTLRRFYDQNKESAGTVTDEQVSDQVLSRLFVNALIADLAKRYNVSVSDEELANEKQTLLKQFPDEATAAADLKKQYDWDLDTYMNRIVRPYLLEQKVETAFTNGADEFGKPFEENQVKARHILFPVEDEKKEAQVKAQAEKILARAKKGEDFATLAKTYTVESEREKGGDLGWFGPGAMVKEFETAAFAVETGGLSGLVKTNYGYHIIKVEERRTVRNFGLLMNDLLSKAKVVMKINVHNPFEAYSVKAEKTVPENRESGPGPDALTGESK